ncbi:ribose-phosphate diphosphokinase [Phenylobacterium sp.]|uniref:ribose-phosphate diphosphokinase n=1 Tax=Phenylobacterium sp. TaxID=1871053 RepID=UPI0027215BF2|nr:ribose-phosphate diphosphokinase [Phenylobacterium sp.]MDO8379056.1 ribose-phosphate diphosphokinase [Phenylobacterium sp.]
MISGIHAFADERAPASRLAEMLGAPLHISGLHVFPDGESLPEVGPATGDVALYRSLNRPDAKLMPLLLAADALRRRGAGRVVLVAPYLCYMRQDEVFRPGQPLSRDVAGRLLGETFDAIVTVEPHLHRTTDLESAFNGAEVVALSAAEPLAAALPPPPPGALVIGPDIESEAWAAALARHLGTPHATFLKTRHGDREIELTFADPALVAGRHVVLIDDVCSTGGTLVAAIRQLQSFQAAEIDVVVTHALFDAEAELRLRKAGARRIFSSDSCPHPTNAASLAPLLAQALKDLSL